MAGLRPPEGGRGDHSGPRAGRGYRGHRRAGGEPRYWPPAASRTGPATRPCAGGWTLSASPTCTGAAPTTSARRPSGPGWPASAAHNHHRLVPPDRRGPQGPGRPPPGSWTRPATPSACGPRSPTSSGSRTSWSWTCSSTGPERNDMVQYFGEQLAGVAVTELGWVQSYGTRYVRPPIIFGDVVPAGADDRRVAHVRPVAHRAAGQGHADRAGDHAEVVVRARRPAPGERPRASSPWPSATSWPTWRRPGSGSSRSTSRPCARPCRCAATAAGPT